MPKFSIVPEIIKSKGIVFYDERDIPIEICDSSDINYINYFEKPSITVNSFAKKTTKKELIVKIDDLEELENMGYTLVSSRGGYSPRQRVIYSIRNKNNLKIGDKRLSIIPENHRIEKDKQNRRIRICGPKSGKNGFGEWIYLEEEKEPAIKTNKKFFSRIPQVSLEELNARAFGIGMINPEKMRKTIYIDDIPIMLTDENELLCIPKTEEVKHIGYIGMCYDKKTEILTNEGWKFFSDLNKRELIAQVNPNNFEIDFVKPISYTKEKYSGKLIHFGDNKRGKVIDLMVTPEHNMFASNKGHNNCYREYKFIKASNLLKGIWKIKQACSKNKTEEKNIPFSPKIMGIYIAEGCVSSKNIVEISQNEGPKLEKIRRMLEDEKIPYREYKRKGKENQIRIYIKLKGFSDYVKKFGKEKDKFIPDWIKNNSKEVIRTFLDWFLLGDGDIHKTKGRKSRKRYCTSSKRLADDIQECLLRIGITSTIGNYGSNFVKKRGIKNYNFYTIEERNENTAYIYSKRNISLSDYDDYVYCVTVPTHLLVIRRNGRIAICGNTGTCKSLGINALLSWDYYLGKRLCVNINDIQKDSFEWSMPANSYIHQLKKINVSPCPTPIVYLFPSTGTLKTDKKDKRFPMLVISLPMKEAIRKIENFFELDKSSLYLKNLTEDLAECSSISEVEDIINSEIPDTAGGMKFKILNIFQSLFENNMLNVAVPECPAILSYNDKYGNNYMGYSIQTILRAGLIPSIQTFDLVNQDFFSAYMSFIVGFIYKNQYEDNYFKDKTISLFVDEIDKLWEGKKNGELIKKALGLIGTNGRMARIGLRWATQNYDKVPDQIRGNTKYLFISRQNDEKMVREINKDWIIPDSMKKDILKLKIDRKDGLFEIIGCTTEEFVLYDLETGEKKRTGETKRGFLIPPIARHRVPGVQI